MNYQIFWNKQRNKQRNKQKTDKSETWKTFKNNFRPLCMHAIAKSSLSNCG